MVLIALDTTLDFKTISLNSLLRTYCVILWNKSDKSHILDLFISMHGNLNWLIDHANKRSVTQIKMLEQLLFEHLATPFQLIGSTSYKSHFILKEDACVLSSRQLKQSYIFLVK